MPEHAPFMNRITLVALGLVAATCVSWEFFQGLANADFPSLGGIAVLLIAFVKTRFILLDFMELRHALLPMRLFAEAWWVGLAVLLALAFHTGFFGL